MVLVGHFEVEYVSTKVLVSSILVLMFCSSLRYMCSTLIKLFKDINTLQDLQPLCQDFPEQIWNMFRKLHGKNAKFTDGLFPRYGASCINFEPSAFPKLCEAIVGPSPSH